MPVLGYSLGTPDGAELLFRGFLPAWAAGLLAVAGVLLAVFVYRREAGRVAGWKRAGLAAVRAAVFLSLVALAMKPTVVREARGEKPRPVAVLVDDTQSMLTKDPRPVTLDKWRAWLAFDVVAPNAPPPDGSAAVPAGAPDAPSRLDVAKAALGNPRLKLLERLKPRGPVQPGRFGGGRAAVDPRDENWVAALTGQEPRTGFLDSVADLLKRDPADLPAAVVAVTDGRDNASRSTVAEVAAECKRAGVPVFVYAVGGSAAGQVVLREAGVPETLFVDDTAVVPVRFRARGFKDAQVEIVLKLSGREVARKVVPVTDGEDQREALSFAPQKSDALPGKQDFTVTVKVVTDPGQASDEQTKPVRVVDRKLKVLVAENGPRWDYKFLQRALLRDRRVEARFWLAQGDREALGGGPPFVPAFPATREELSGYDLLVIGDLPASAFTPTQMDAVREFVAEGGGLIHIAGPDGSTQTWVNTPLADVLPVEVSADAQTTGARADTFRPAPTPAGARAGALRLADDPAESAAVWKELPGVYGFTPSARLKPAAETLLAHPAAKTLDGKPAPVLAGHYYGKGYVLFSAIDETWRWRYNAADKYFGRYWSQLVYLAGAPRTLGTKLTQLSLDTPDPVLGGSSQVYARLLKPDLTPQTADSVEAVVERLDAGAGPDGRRTERVVLQRLPGQPGEYTAAVPFNRTGKFSLTVDNGGNPGTVEYRVGLPADHELSTGGPAEDDLRALAEGSGGKFYREEDLNRLPDDVTPQSTPTLTREETVLWNRWALVWVAVLLSLEWTLRRVVSLS